MPTIVSNSVILERLDNVICNIAEIKDTLTKSVSQVGELVTKQAIMDEKVSGMNTVMTTLGKRVEELETDLEKLEKIVARLSSIVNVGVKVFWSIFIPFLLSLFGLLWGIATHAITITFN